jgi:hypothetical protein
MEKKLLIDTVSFKLQLMEDNAHRGNDGRPKIIARGEFARADLATENKRIYPFALWERELRRLQEQLGNKKVFGELDHPMDGRTSLKRVSHIVTGLHLENGVVIGEAEILETTEGMNLRKILEAGGAVGVSSRGFGTTRPNLKGEDVVQEDYRLMTFDFVAEPANVTSYPTIHAEGKKTPAANFTEAKPTSSVTTNKIKPRPVTVQAEASMSKDLTLEKLRKENPSLYEHFADEAQREYERKGAELWAKKIMSAKQEAASDLRGTFAEQLTKALEDARDTIADEERNRLLQDPTVAGAKAAMEALKDVLRPFVIPSDVEKVVQEKEEQIVALRSELAQQELKMVKLAEENEKLGSIAKEAGYRFHLEKLLNGSPQSDLIRKLVGDVKVYESVGAINAKVEAIVEEIQSVAVKTEARDAEVARLVEENGKLRKAAEKSLEATKHIALQSYVEQRLLHHPRATEVRVLMEGNNYTSKEEVDTLLSKMREPRRDEVTVEEARQRVRKLAGSAQTRESILEHEERGNRNGQSSNGAGADFNGLGMSIDQLRALSGMGDGGN